jgi:hypothetical protein
MKLSLGLALLAMLAAPTLASCFAGGGGGGSPTSSSGQGGGGSSLSAGAGGASSVNTVGVGGAASTSTSTITEATTTSASASNGATTTGGANPCEPGYKCADAITQPNGDLGKLCTDSVSYALYHALYACVCEAGGACKAACGSNYCGGLAATAACTTCVQDFAAGCANEFNACANH